MYFYVTDMNLQFLLFKFFFTIFHASCQNTVCDNDGALMIDGLDCTKFFKCSNGVPHLLRCPEGLR